jgi:hypothetical protein
VETPAAPRLHSPEPVVESPAPAVVVETQEEERPAVRLVSSTETQEGEAPVPYPWSPASNRPQRTPPRQKKGAGDAGTGDAPLKTAVKLTPEELAALLQEPKGKGKVQEGGS